MAANINQPRHEQQRTYADAIQQGPLRPTTPPRRYSSTDDDQARRYQPSRPPSPPRSTTNSTRQREEEEEAYKAWLMEANQSRNRQKPRRTSIKTRPPDQDQQDQQDQQAERPHQQGEQPTLTQLLRELSPALILANEDLTNGLSPAQYQLLQILRQEDHHRWRQLQQQRCQQPDHPLGIRQPFDPQRQMKQPHTIDKPNWFAQFLSIEINYCDTCKTPDIDNRPIPPIIWHIRTPNTTVTLNSPVLELIDPNKMHPNSRQNRIIHATPNTLTECRAGWLTPQNSIFLVSMHDLIISIQTRQNISIYSQRIISETIQALQEQLLRRGIFISPLELAIQTYINDDIEFFPWTIHTICKDTMVIGQRCHKFIIPVRVSVYRTWSSSMIKAYKDIQQQQLKPTRQPHLVQGNPNHQRFPQQPRFPLQFQQLNINSPMRQQPHHRGPFVFNTPPLQWTPSKRD